MVHERQMAPGFSGEARRLRTGRLAKQFGIVVPQSTRPKTVVMANRSTLKVILCARDPSVKRSVGSLEAGPLFFFSRRRPGHGSATLSP